MIIGNPPFLGAKRLKPERGADYVNRVRKAYPEVPGMADYCVYWFRKAHDALPACTAADPLSGRAGLVGTQNIRNNQSRVGGLDHIVRDGTIIEAVDNQPWSGEANVNVSIANWLRSQDSDVVPSRKRIWHVLRAGATIGKGRRPRDVASAKNYDLESRDCEHISSSLSDQTDVSQAVVLTVNTVPQRSFAGQFPRHHGFVLNPEEAKKLLSADTNNAGVVYPFFIGEEMVTIGRPKRWVIDFQQMPIYEASSYTMPFEQVRRTVLPHIEYYAAKERKQTGKETGQDQNWLRVWWQHFRCRKEMIDRINSLSRYIACPEITKRPIFCFISPKIRPDHRLRVFGFNDDYSFGMLQSL